MLVYLSFIQWCLFHRRNGAEQPTKIHNGTRTKWEMRYMYFPFSQSVKLKLLDMEHQMNKNLKNICEITPEIDSHRRTQNLG